MKRCIIKRALLFACFCCGSAMAEAPALRHLFLDPALLPEMDKVALHVNPPQQRELVIRPDHPWEQLMITFYLTVREEGGKLRLWYTCRDKAKQPNVAYAESVDGIHWTKPNLGLVEYAGSKENNLVGLTSMPFGNSGATWDDLELKDAFGVGISEESRPFGHGLTERARAGSMASRRGSLPGQAAYEAAQQ